jgi:hypothetical protein
METVSAICEDDYTYKCKYFEPQHHPDYDFSKYCIHDKDRCSLCSSHDAIKDSIIDTIKQNNYGVRILKTSPPKPMQFIDPYEDGCGFNG